MAPPAMSVPALRAVSESLGWDFLCLETSFTNVWTSRLLWGATTKSGRSSNMLASWLYISLALAESSNSPAKPAATSFCLNSSIPLKLTVSGPKTQP